MNLTTGDCAQRLNIQDGESEFDIACDDHNAFKKRTVYISTSNDIKLRLDNSLEGSNGYFWIQVKGKRILLILIVLQNKYRCYELFDKRVVFLVFILF